MCLGWIVLAFVLGLLCCGGEPAGAHPGLSLRLVGGSALCRVRECAQPHCCGTALESGGSLIKTLKDVGIITWGLILGVGLLLCWVVWLSSD